MAAVPGQKQPPPPNRIVRRYMPGSSAAHGVPMDPSMPWASVATAPYEGSLDTTPPRISHLGTSSQSRTVAIPNLSIGQQHVASAIIPLSLLPGFTSNQVAPPTTGPGPTPRTPLLSRREDQLIFRSSMTVGNLLPGLHVLRFTAVPQARSGSQIFNADGATGALPAGQQYSSFMVACTVTFEAEQAVAAGIVTLSTEGTLTRQAGGGVS